MDNVFCKACLIFILLLFIFLIGTTFFINPIYIWDEAIYANNALEMSHTHNMFVLTLDYQPDLYNTKPPLAIWLMAISIKLFGANEFAVRLPSILAFLGLLIVVLRFSKKHFGSYNIGLIACLVLLGSEGLLISHGVRSGDLDSLLLLCATILTLGSIKLFFSKESEKINFKKEFFKIGGIILTGFFIKSTTIFLLLPGLLLCLVISKNRTSILKQKLLYIIPIILLVIIFLYYLLMHYLHPGYNRQVFFSEYKRVYSDIMPWHRQPATWYIYNFINWRFTPFFYFLLPALLLGLFSADKIIKQFTLFSAITGGFFLLIISFVPDKLGWYDLPVYPLFALMIGIGISEGVKRIFNLPGISGRFKNILNLVIIAILCIPVFSLREKILSRDILDDFEKEAYCLKQIRKVRPGIKNITVLMTVENPYHRLSLDFYRKALKNNLTIKTVSYVSELHKGDTVLCSQKNKMDSLKGNFTGIDTVYNFKYGKIFAVN